MRAARVITVGRIYTPHYVHVQNCGFPGGFLMYWRGRIGFGQPSEFLRWADVLSALKHRLALAGLELAQPVLPPPEYVSVPVCVTVQRRGKKLRKRAYENQIQIQKPSADIEPHPEAPGRGEVETAGHATGDGSAETAKRLWRHRGVRG